MQYKVYKMKTFRHDSVPDDVQLHHSVAASCFILYSPVRLNEVLNRRSGSHKLLNERSVNHTGLVQ